MLNAHIFHFLMMLLALKFNSPWNHWYHKGWQLRAKTKKNPAELVLGAFDLPQFLYPALWIVNLVLDISVLPYHCNHFILTFIDFLFSPAMLL
jgi:hypothetical protein